MISVLNGSGDSLSAVLSGAPATTQPSYSVLWSGDGGPANPVGLLTGVTDKELLAGVGGRPREVQEVLIYNADTSEVQPTISKISGGVTYPLVKGTIPVGGTLRWRQDGLTILNSGASTPTGDIGAVVSGLGLTAVETGSGPLRRTVITLTDTPMTITNALAYAGLKLYDFPAGRLRIINCLTSLTFTTTSAIAGTLNSGATVSHGIGSVTASSITLATTMMNMMPGSGEAVNDFTSSTTINVASDVATGKLAAVAGAQHGAILDGTGTPIDMFLNLGLADADEIDADATLLINGTIQVTWINGGDL